jgi:hypothetical protein
MRLPLCALLALSTACAGARGGSAAPDESAAGGVRHISWAEVQGSGGDALTAWDLIQRLRPAMLRPRTVALRGRTGGPVSPVAYRDGIRLTDLQALRTIARDEVYEIRFLSAAEATTRWGIGHASGAILVVTRQ